MLSSIQIDSAGTNTNTGPTNVMQQQQKLLAGRLTDFQVLKDEQAIAVTTPIPARDGRTSKKTPVFHLPIYRLQLQLDKDHVQRPIVFQCDLADMMDLISKLKRHENLLLRQQSNTR